MILAVIVDRRIAAHIVVGSSGGHGDHCEKELELKGGEETTGTTALLIPCGCGQTRYKFLDAIIPYFSFPDRSPVQ